MKSESTATPDRSETKGDHALKFYLMLGKENRRKLQI